MAYSHAFIMNKDKDKEAKIVELARQKLDGKSYSDIRGELNREGFTEEEISSLIRKADEMVLEETFNMSTGNRNSQRYTTGLIIAIAGLILAIAFNAGIMLKEFPALAVYSPFLVGIILMIYSRLVQKKKASAKKIKPGPIRQKRPYK